MLKELIVSVNGREKKIAIIENGKVTEFYIERGESESGIVGNIYKGRVMRVLPGMQSAFVDIALERDAFLYVSDFFDEEEEFERIVIDKSKEQTALPPPLPAAERGSDRDSGRGRGRERDPRRKLPAGAPDRLAQEDASEPAESVFSEDEEVVRSVELEVPLGAVDEARAIHSDYADDDDDDAIAVVMQPRVAREEARDKTDTFDARTNRFGEEAVDTPFVKHADTSFQRVEDDELAAEDGSMLKDAMLQERITDRIRAVDFDIEQAATPTGPFSTSQTMSAFQRIDDGGEDLAGSASQISAPLPERVAAHINSFIEETTEGSIVGTPPHSFERVSDDEVAAESEAGLTDESATKGAAGGRRRRSAGKSKAPTAVDETPAPPESAATATPEDETAKPKRGRGRGKADSEKGASERKPVGTRRARGGAKRSSENGEAATAINETEPAAPQQLPLEDAEANVSATRTRGEFATRRGGRRRRRGGKPAEGGPGGNEERGGNVPTGGSADNGEPEEMDEALEPAPAISANFATAPVAAAPALSNTSAGTAPSTVAPQQQPQGDRHSGGNRGNRHGGGNGRSSARRERPAQPMITDLLREGQEILVQIAKEPISQKGARITSHIALPGRYLVYMPTIEHVGVSRKIESDGERARLRKLIQAIRAEEDVPSGGFIVRTAGVGISEEDLRNDARYLVRTWLDVRRSAEKTKAPALVHRDLDLVQRLLRDHLSDEFTAIRVDSEEEYLRIIEFVNRIQPKLVNRVKLYTREQPILEAYGVQVEIDKAVKPRVWLRSGGYLVINQTEALVAIDVNTGKFVGRGGNRLEDTITKTNLEAVEEIVRQIRLRDLGGIIVLDLIDMEERRNRQRVMQALQEALQNDKSPTKVLSFNDFGLVIMTRKRVKQSLERTLCAPCSYCQGAGLVKSPQTVCYEVLEEARSLARGMNGEPYKQVTLRVNPEVARALRSDERDVLVEIEDYLGPVDLNSDERIHQEQYDFAFA